MFSFCCLLYPDTPIDPAFWNDGAAGDVVHLYAPVPVNALLAFKDPISMYEAIYNDGGDTIYLYDQIEDKRGSGDFSNKFALENASDNLEIREKYIMDERFIMGKSQVEIANELSISQAQVSRLEKKAIKELKKVLK